MISFGLGAIIGLVMALTGAGGGILAVPLLVFGLDLQLPQAAPMALAAVGLAAALGAMLGLKSGKVRYKAASLIALSGMVVAPLGLYAAHLLPHKPLLLAFAAVLVYVAINMLRKSGAQAALQFKDETCGTSPCQMDDVAGHLIWTVPCARALALSGVLTGFLSGMLGVGGGFVVVPALKKASNLPMQHILPTSLAVIALVSLSGVVASAIENRINWMIALPFCTGALLAMLAGRLIVEALPSIVVQRAFAVFALFAALSLAYKAVAT